MDMHRLLQIHLLLLFPGAVSFPGGERDASDHGRRMVVTSRDNGGRQSEPKGPACLPSASHHGLKDPSSITMPCGQTSAPRLPGLYIRPIICVNDRQSETEPKQSRCPTQDKHKHLPCKDNVVAYWHGIPRVLPACPTCARSVNGPPEADFLSF